MFAIRPPKVVETEQAHAREDLIKRQEQINTEGNVLADIDDVLTADTKALEDHNDSFFWFQSKSASSVGFYWIMAGIFCLLLIIDITFIGVAATDSFIKAVVLPAGFLIFETLLLCFIVYKLIELGGNIWPVDKSRIDKKKMRLGSTYGYLTFAKNMVVVVFGLWAFFLMVDSHRYEMMVEQMMAGDAAILSGGTHEVDRITRWEAATDSVLPWLYGLVAIFMHWVYTRFQEMIFFAVSYFFGYRRKYKTLTASIRKNRSERRVHLGAIGSLYSRYLSDKSEAELKYTDFRAPEDVISSTAYSYIEEYLGGKGGSPTPETTHVHSEIVLPKNGREKAAV